MTRLREILEEARLRAELSEKGRRKLTPDQQRTAIEIMEIALNGQPINLRPRGKRVKIIFVKEIESLSV